MAKREVRNDDRGAQFKRMAPGQKMTAVVPNDDEDNCPANATLYIGTGGTLTIIPEGNDDGDTVPLVVTDGQWLDQVSVRRVLDTGTAASDIFAVY